MVPYDTLVTWHYKAFLEHCAIRIYEAMLKLCNGEPLTHQKWAKLSLSRICDRRTRVRYQRGVQSR